MRLRLAVLFLGLAGAALAHEGVKNPAVQARMHGMKMIGQSSKVLGRMAKAETPFDATEARQAASEIATGAKRIGELFEANESDPKSEALPIIWKDHDDFLRMGDDLFRAANGAEGRIDTLEDLQREMRAIGKACGACHEVYRQK